jgi:hypothetical protein
MLRTGTIAAFMLVVLVGFGVKIMVAPGTTVAATEPNPVTVYDLHVGHPNMKSLPVQEAPLP